MQVAAAAGYGVPTNQSAAAAAAVSAATAAAQIQPGQQAALQGLAASQQPGVVHVPYPATPAGVQQFQVNGQPTTIAL